MKQHLTAVLTNKQQEAVVLLDPDRLVAPDQLKQEGSIVIRKVGNLKNLGFYLSEFVKDPTLAMV